MIAPHTISRDFHPLQKGNLKIITLLLLLLCFQTAKSQLVDSLREKLYVLNNYFPQEKIYLHMDKPYYVQGENIWFKLYIKIGHVQEEEKQSSIAYVDLIGPENQLLETKTVKVINGGAAGDFSLPDSLHGKFRIRAYSNFMRTFGDDYFYTKGIDVFPLAADKESIEAISDQEVDFDLQFFPEGGDLVYGLQSYLGFKAIDTNGKGVGVKGVILDQEGNLKAVLQSGHRGIGGTSFSPEKGKTYHAEVTAPSLELSSTFSLPPILEEGVVVRAIVRTDDIEIYLAGSINTNLKGYTLVGQMEGQIVFGYEIAQSTFNSLIKIPHQELNTGVLQITLFNPSGLPICERLVFIENNSHAPLITVQPEKEHFKKRSLASIEINLQLDNEPISGNLSVTITDDASIYKHPHSSNIKTYFLLESDLRGEIEEPGIYFDEKQKGRKNMLDQLMITQGWRRFNWENLTASNFPQLDYLMESGVTISGTTTKYGNSDKETGGLVTLASIDPPHTETIETDSLGRFYFVGINPIDSIAFTLKGNEMKQNGEPRNKPLRIVLDKDDKPEIDALSNERLETSIKNLNRFIADSEKINAIEQAYNWENTVMLGEVTIDGSRNSGLPDVHDPFEMATSMYGNRPSSRLIMDSLPVYSYLSPLDALVGTVAGLTVYGNYPNYTFQIRGQNLMGGSTEELMPLFVINGAPTDMSAALLINPLDVEYIDVLRGPKAAIFGSRGTNGVILIYTKTTISRNYEAARQPGLLSFMMPAYDVAREFYTPKYDVKKEEHIKPDYRTTLFWTPNVTTNESGKAIIEFYTSDAESNYTIEVQGITDADEPVVHLSKLSVK